MGCGASKPRGPIDRRPSEIDGPPPLQPIGTLKSVKVDDIGPDGPMLIGTDPMPPQMRGLFWVRAQGESSCLASLGGPSRDGGGCSTGVLRETSYFVRVPGDRTWAFADKDVGTLKAAALGDLIYRFEWDSVSNPTSCQIYPKAMNAGGFELTATWILSFKMDLVPEGMLTPPTV